MLTRNRLACSAAAAAVALLVAASAAAEPAVVPEDTPVQVHFSRRSEIRTEKGTELRLPPGYFFNEMAYDSVDLEMKRLQNAETRLTAENNSLRESDGPGWGTVWLVAGALALGVAAG